MRSEQPDTEGGLQELVTAAAGGSRAARDDLVRELLPEVRVRVHAMLEGDFRRTNRWMLAAFSTGDVVQQVFLDVIRSLDKFEFRGRDKLVGYFSRVAHRNVLALVAHHTAASRNERNRVPEPERGMDALPAEDGIEPGLAASLLEQIRIFWEVHRLLSDRQKLLIELRLIEGLDYESIANELGFSSSDSARMAYYAARARLLVKLQERGVRGGGGSEDTEARRKRRHRFRPPRNPPPTSRGCDPPSTRTHRPS